MLNKFVVYTAAFGPQVKLMPQKRFKGVDFICFSDVNRKVKGWKIKLVDPLFSEDNTRNNRYYKLLPHLCVSHYEKSIYIDGNILVTQLPADFFASQMGEFSMLVFDHNQTKGDARNCIYEEYEALVNLYRQGTIKDDPEVMKSQVGFFRQEGYPANNGLIKGAVLIRNHNDSKLIETMNLWWDFVKNRSRRDQLSFNYVAWKTGLKFGYLPGDIRRGNPWFYFAGKTDKLAIFSLLKYRFRKISKQIKQAISQKSQ